MTLEQALKLADQDCPLPVLAGEALKVLRAEIEDLAGKLRDGLEIMREIQSVPDGFALVPTVITDAMEYAWHNIPPGWAGTTPNRYGHMLMHAVHPPTCDCKEKRDARWELWKDQNKEALAALDKRVLEAAVAFFIPSKDC